MRSTGTGIDKAMSVSALDKEELLYFIEQYNEYTGRFSETGESCIRLLDVYEFFQGPFQDILNDDEENREESM